MTLPIVLTTSESQSQLKSGTVCLNSLSTPPPPPPHTHTQYMAISGCYSTVKHSPPHHTLTGRGCDEGPSESRVSLVAVSLATVVSVLMSSRVAASFWTCSLMINVKHLRIGGREGGV